MKSSFHLGKVMGIPLGINYSWFIIFFLITLTLAQYYFPRVYPHWATLTYWVVALGTSLLFFASVVAHELAHSLVSVRSGIPVKSITLFVFGGVARISREATRPSTELLMAAAGPLSSIVIAGLFALVWLLTEDIVEPVAAMSFYLCWINLVLAAFNMVPGFPLDGGRVLRSLIWGLSGSYRRATRIATLSGRGISYLFILGGLLIIFFFDLVLGLWLAFIGGFLNVAASASYRQAMLLDTLRGFTAQDLMSRDCHLLPSELTLEALVNDYFLPLGHRCLLVGEWSKLRGIITLQDIKRVPKQRWGSTTVAEAMTPSEKIGLVYPSDDVPTILERIEEEGMGLVLVVAEGRPIGIIERDHLLQSSRARSELGV